MLEIKNVWKTFNKGTVNEKQALCGVNLTLNDGDFCTVIGGNGAGKSTTLNAIAGVWPVDCGQILIDGKDISALPEHKRAPYLGRVFQDPMTGTVADMEIIENLAIAARRGKKRGLSWGVKADERFRYRQMLAEFDLGLEDRMSSKVGLLSGGQRQAITLLMATIKKPKLLLLDERFARKPDLALTLLRRNGNFECVDETHRLGLAELRNHHGRESPVCKGVLLPRGHRGDECGQERLRSLLSRERRAEVLIQV